MKKLLLLSLIILASCGDNTETIIEEECVECWELVEVVREVISYNNHYVSDDIYYIVTGESTCTGERKTGVSEESSGNDPFTYEGNVICNGLFEEWYTFE